jgi:hypothetical protein
MKLRELLSVLPEEIDFHLLDEVYDHEVATIVGNPLTTYDEDEKEIVAKYDDLMDCEVEILREHWLGLTYVVKNAPYGRVYQFQFELAGYGEVEVEPEEE